MICPFCNTENRDDREYCYYCNKDLSILRLIVNKAKHHYNLAIDHAERNRFYQAITELQNSLDLDKNNIGARVLLGTIYAKQKKITLAIKEWQKALKLNTDTHKAYNYIEKAQKIKSALPVLKWVKFLLAGLFASCLVICLLLFLIVRPDPSVKLLENAIKDYNENRYSLALDKMDAFERKYEKSSLSPLADIFSDSIRAKIDQMNQKILNFMYARKYSEALKLCAELETFQPGDKTQSFLKYIKDDVRVALKKSIEKKLADYRAGGIDLSLLREDIDDFTQFFPQDEDAQNYKSRLTALKQWDTQKEYLALKNEIDQILSLKNRTTIISELIKFKRIHPKFAKEAFINRKIDEIRESLLYDKLNQIHSQIHNNNLQQARLSLKEFSKEQISRFPLIRDEYNRLLSHLQKITTEQTNEESRDYLEKLETAMNEDQISLLISLLSQKDSYILNKKQENRLNELHEIAQTKNAIKLYNQLFNRPLLSNTQTLSESEARQTLSSLSSITENLPEETYRHVRDKLLFYACISHMKLGETKQAKKIFSDLLREFPHSPYLSLAAKIVTD